ncbi:MAG: hypothetical protein GX953_05175, partial [Bifidobacterium sp.]|nr:hypothetical protein [Bifidobacterium sp.]
TGDSAMPEPSAVEGASSLLADLNLMLPAGIHAALPSLTQDRAQVSCVLVEKDSAAPVSQG